MIYKFHSLLFILFFLVFLTSLFPISPIQTSQKILNIFVVLYYMDYRFYQRILENSWIFTKKNRDIWNTKHFQNSNVYYLLSDFLVFLTSFFLFNLSIIVKKFLNFLCCFIRWIQDFIKELCKTIVFFFLKKSWDLWNPKFTKITSFTISLLFFYHFLYLLFSISPIQTCEKIMVFFVAFYWNDYRFYQRILKIPRSS